jgi:hypothetical protein
MGFEYKTYKITLLSGMSVPHSKLRIVESEETAVPRQRLSKRFVGNKYSHNSGALFASLNNLPIYYSLIIQLLNVIKSELLKRIAHCLDIRLTYWRCGCQPYAPTSLYSPETYFFCLWYSLLLEGK